MNEPNSNLTSPTADRDGDLDVSLRHSGFDDFVGQEAVDVVKTEGDDTATEKLIRLGLKELSA